MQKKENLNSGFITIFICNDTPDCDDIDNAFSNRLRINFNTEYCIRTRKK